MSTKRGLRIFVVLAFTLLFWHGQVGGAEPPIKIGIVQGFSGALEAYAKQMLTGFKMGLEYGTKGKNEVLGRKIDLIVEDDQLKPDVAKRLITKLYADDKVDLVVGTTSSAAALAMLTGGFGVQENFAGGTRSGRFHHGQRLESIYFQNREKFGSGRHLQCESRCQAGSLSCRHGAGLCVWKGWRRGL